jgi:hypothetical protein
MPFAESLETEIEIFDEEQAREIIIDFIDSSWMHKRGNSEETR